MERAAEARGRCVFLGTSAFAVPSLRALAEAGEDVALVVTQPDRPRGRGRQPVPSPVKAAAAALSLPVYQPESVNAPEAVARLAAEAPEFLAVVAYGQLLKPPLLALPGRGAVNLHASLLPLHRGPSPIAWTIWQGDERAGNTTMFMEAGLDSGPVLLQESVPLPPSRTRGDLEEELAARGAALLVETLRRLRAGEVSAVPQDHARATWSRLLTREMRTVAWDRPAVEVLRHVHALSPAPAVLARVRGRLLKLLRVEVAEGAAGGAPGQVVEVRPDGPVVACGQGALLLREVQPEGKRAMPGGDFARGGGAAPGDFLEVPGDV